MRDPTHDATETQARNGPGVSRRDFFRGTGAAVAVTSLAHSVEESLAQERQKAAAIAPAAPQKFTLNINGKDQSVEVEPRVTLLDVLRDDLLLTGGKEVCTTTNCGACTVLIDGKATYACSQPAVACQGKKIQTVEGLGGEHKVVTAFVKHDATQCGFCTPGFVVACKAFCEQHPNASRNDINQGLGGNICRCGTYAGVIEAAIECAKGG